MRAIITLLFFIGMFMIVAGVYEQRFRTMNKLVRTEYKFVPRTMYDEAYGGTTDLNAVFKSNFASVDPWTEKTSGGVERLPTKALQS
jgi:hypothetical protein